MTVAPPTMLQSLTGQNQAPVRNSSSGLAWLGPGSGLDFGFFLYHCSGPDLFLGLGLGQVTSLLSGQEPGLFLTTSIDSDMKSMEVSCLALCLALTLAPSWLWVCTYLLSSPKPGFDIVFTFRPRTGSRDFFFRPKTRANIVSSLGLD